MAGETEIRGGGDESARSTEPTRIFRAAPIFRVSDLHSSIAYYRDALGFALQWGDDTFCCVTRDELALFLCHGDQGNPGTWIWVGASDVDTLHEEFTARQAMIRHEPRNFPWGSRELHVTDPDGHVIRFGSDLKEGEPYGEWLDGKGRRWRQEEDGSWQAVV